MIIISNLTKKFEGKIILENLNFSFQPGMVYGFWGQNGVGKTTLFKCISGLETFEGSIQSEFSPLKNKIGLLLADPFILNRITGEEYVHLLCSARGVKIKDIEKFNIFKLPLNEFAINYSLGMKKKLALTAILLQNNEMFILDEPFNGIDMFGKNKIEEIIKQLKHDNKIILISSHDLIALKRNCDKIIFLKSESVSTSFDKEDFEKLDQEILNL
ncbi:MAG TPA: ABC transporter ATP-binding protein [Edaphocola sp.]|nr:ABC transporter ATP-binding protein [Edaphocola sp.]